MPKYHIVMFPKIQVDTTVAFYLLKTFGASKFPEIADAELLFWTSIPDGRNAEQLQSEGYILIDMGNGPFDHHRLGQDNRKISASHLIASYLEIDDRPDLQKLLEFARRDDLEGKGTLSTDQIDRAFGFAGLLMALNKSEPESPAKILQTVLPLIAAHHKQERSKFEQLPAEYQQLVSAGKAKVFNALQLGKKLKVYYVESDNTALASYLRSRAIGADMVIQKSSTGHVNFISRQAVRLQLHKLASSIKLLEAEKNNILMDVDSMKDLEKPGRTEGLPHWYYDARANTLQNGGVSPQGIPPTRLSYQEIESIVKQALNISRQDDYHANKFPQNKKGRGYVIID